MIEEGDLVKVKYEIRVDGEKIEEKEVESLVGLSFIYPFIERILIGKDIGEYKEILPPEKAFGKKDPSLIQIIPMRYFRINGVNPRPGMFIEVDGSVGRIISVSGGRVLVDFNHPLAGKEIEVRVSIISVEKDPKKKISFLSKVILNRDIRFDVEDRKVKIYESIPEDLKEMFLENVRKLGYEVEMHG